MQKRDCFPAVPSRFSDSRSSGRRLAIDAQTVVRHWHLHPGGAVVHGHHHRGHCGQHHGNDEPLYKIRQFFSFVTSSVGFRSAEGAGAGQQFRRLRPGKPFHPRRALCCARAGAVSFRKAGKAGIGAVIPCDKTLPARCGRRDGSPAPPSCPRDATGAPDRHCPPGSRRRNRSSRTQTPVHRLCPKEL